MSVGVRAWLGCVHVSSSACGRTVAVVCDSRLSGSCTSVCMCLDVSKGVRTIVVVVGVLQSVGSHHSTLACPVRALQCACA